jgi:hypothetical protein
MGISKRGSNKADDGDDDDDDDVASLSAPSGEGEGCVPVPRGLLRQVMWLLGRPLSLAVAVHLLLSLSMPLMHACMHVSASHSHLAFPCLRRFLPLPPSHLCRRHCHRHPWPRRRSGCADWNDGRYRGRRLLRRRRRTLHGSPAPWNDDDGHGPAA